MDAIENTKPICDAEKSFANKKKGNITNRILSSISSKTVKIANIQKAFLTFI